MTQPQTTTPENNTTPKKKGQFWKSLWRIIKLIIVDSEKNKAEKTQGDQAPAALK